MSRIIKVIAMATRHECSTLDLYLIITCTCRNDAEANVSERFYWYIINKKENSQVSTVKLWWRFLSIPRISNVYLSYM